MLLNIVLIIVIILSFSAISFIVGGKFSKLKTLDLETIPEVRHERVRNRIIMERIKRQSARGREMVRKNVGPFGLRIKKIISGLWKRVYALEEKYKQESKQKVSLVGEELKNKIKASLDEADKLCKEEKYNEAEKKYIEIISVSAKSAEAYKGLAQVYLKLKEYKQALQVFEFVLKLEIKNSKKIEKKDEAGRTFKTVSNAAELSVLYSNIGSLHSLLGNVLETLENYGKALAFEPNNPRTLDQMIEACIMAKNKILALDMLKRLESVNPDNQKLKEYSDKIREL